MTNRLFTENKNIKENVKNDTFLKQQVERIKSDSEKFANKDIAALTYTSFKKFYVTGSRKEYEYEYFLHRRRLNDFAILNIIYDDEKYRLCLQDIIWSILDEFTWALPAHIPQNTDIENCITHIDLFASETAFALAEISHILSDKLDKTIVERIKYEVYRRVLKPYLSGRKNSWDCLENNWSAVCAGSVGSAFLYFGTDEEIQTVLPRIKETLEYYLNGFGDDGACVEGINYWAYGFGYFTYFAQLLYQYSDGKDNLLDNKKVENISVFPQKLWFKNNNTVTFSDCGDKFTQRSGLIHFLKQKYSQIAVHGDNCSLEFDGDDCYRFAHLIRDFAWRKNNINVQTESENGFDYFKNAGWYIKRTSNYEFAAKAGDNKESHNHNDIGVFLLNVGGDKIVTDPGRGEYTSDYFSSKRYKYFPPSALAHSVPVVNGIVQQEGEEYRGNIVKATENELIIDCKDAYNDCSLKELTRKFEFYDDKIVLNDDFTFDTDKNDVTEHFVFDVKPTECENGLKIGNTEMCYNVSDFECKINEVTYASHYNKQKTVYTVDLKHIVKTKTFETKFEFNIKILERSENK